MKKLIVTASLLIVAACTFAQDIRVTVRPEQPYDWLNNTPSVSGGYGNALPVYQPDWAFLERMQGMANAQIRSMIDAGYYYDDIDNKWVPPDECKRRYATLHSEIERMEHSKHDISGDGWYTANYYFTNSPIAIMYGGDVYIKKGELKRLRFNSSLSTKFTRRSHIYKNRVGGNVSNKRSGSYYGKYITIYLLSKSE